MGTKVRILAVVPLDGITYTPDQVVDLPPAVAKALAAAGHVDPHKEAVAYCVNTLGAKVLVHASAPSAPSADEQRLQAEIAKLQAEIAKLQAEIAQLEADLSAAAEADQPAIQQALDAAKQSLAALAE